jgi:lysyl-tRNA synthetase class 2
MSLALVNKNALLLDRAAMLAAARTFFQERKVTEVDCPLVSASASIDAHIDLIPALDVSGKTRYLHSSPEYGMKRLLASGLGDIYQLSHVFRQGEQGMKHNPEFMMAEWYRLEKSFDFLIEETVDFIRLFLGRLPRSILSYRELFQTFAGFDYLKADNRTLLSFLNKNGIEACCDENANKDDLLNQILGTIIEPQLGKDELTVLAYYPASQAALAQTVWRGEEKVAERFEIYYKGLELCNGYHELADAAEQRQRLIESNTARQELGKNTLPIDENFLRALEEGLPECCGVAVGFDRLMMLRHEAAHISEVIPFDWDHA